MKVTKRERVRAQVKSRWYYTFWGTATVAVVAWHNYMLAHHIVLWQNP